ncbi:MAG TPA: VCBS repeat-containing protein, partial [candidate division Zixibacteria bacterium]|nr:VCBS repeat-containing protein [candidate division Zixibacteria bacterium]
MPSLNVVSEGTFQFSWSSTSADIGIWRAVFNICDSTGNCINKEAIIQIVENDSFLVDFAVTQSPEPFTFATSVGLGNFDSDAHPEIASTGLAWNATPSFALYDDVGSGVFSEVFAADIYFPRRGLQIGYLDNDENLDLIHFRHPGTVEILVYHGDGDNGFALPDTSFLSSTNWSLTAALGNYNDDEFLDYALAGLSYVRILAGSSASDFTIQSEINVGDSIMSIVSKDLNNDGYDDLVIGHRGGIKVYLGSSTGDLTYLTSYTQTFGSVNIEVTNEGADFNGDNYFDLCVATPSVGNVSSQLVVYLGNGDGTFVKRITREVMGHVVANAPGDLNNDGLVDIAYLNSSRKHLGILYGDGDGYFTNELRYSVATLDPARLVCSDFDLDGDIDAMVNTSRFQQGSYLLLYENQTDPGSYMSMSAEFSGEDNAQLELISPTNRVLNRLGSSIPASSYYRRNLNLNDKMDDFTKLNLVESGDYILNVKPDPSQPAGTPFTVEFTADGQKYRLAKDAVMAAGTYEFAVTFQGGSGIAPRSGGFVHINPPVFNWPAKANVDFQLAADIDFTNVLVNETIASSSYQPASPLAVLDTTTYYWRFRPAGSG